MLNFFYNLNTTFSFGQYKDRSLENVLLDDPTYIHWCFQNVNNFCISIECYKEIKSLFPSFMFYICYGCNICSEEFYIETFAEDYNCDEEDYSFDSYDETPSYKNYRGTYAQDEMGYSDDDIDTIFDGDPSAYWNID